MPETKPTEHVDAVLTGGRCSGCGQFVFPTRAFCPACLTETVAPAPLTPSGSLYSYSVVHIAPQGWQVPYVVGYVDLPEGVRVFAHIEGGDTQLYPDMPVEFTRLETLQRDALVPIFRPGDRP
jgi:uncharacterized OB-fold protein